MAKRDPSLHEGHRKRMKAQFLENGFLQFNDHQKLELMLFYALPRGDTNELAHNLLKECGGKFHNVFDTPYRKLISIKGVSEHTASFLKLFPEAASYYISSKQMTIGESYAEEIKDVCRYFEGVFLNSSNEEIHAMAVGDDLRVLREKKIADGTVGEVTFSPRILMEFVMECGCERVILAHNHPNGSGIASREDVLATRHLVSIFRQFDIEITDHIVVGTNGSQSMRSSIAAGGIWRDE